MSEVQGRVVAQNRRPYRDVRAAWWPIGTPHTQASGKAGDAKSATPKARAGCTRRRFSIGRFAPDIPVSGLMAAL